MTASLSAQNVTAHFNGLHALGPISFEVGHGQFVAVVGPSGCGKSTLIRAFAGLQKVSGGRLQIDGVTIDRPSARVGLMFQSANLMPWRTVRDNIALPLELAGVNQSGRMVRVAELLPMLGLDGFEDALPGELSGGMAQRVALGRVLAHQPDVLLLDEPFGALDAMTREQISIDLLQMLRAAPKTVMMVTHDINEAVLMADRVIVMSKRPGRLAADIAVNLPRPRHLEMVYEPDFAPVARQVRAAISG